MEAGADDALTVATNFFQTLHERYVRDRTWDYQAVDWYHDGLQKCMIVVEEEGGLTRLLCDLLELRCHCLDDPVVALKTTTIEVWLQFGDK